MTHPLQAHFSDVAALLIPLKATFDDSTCHGMEELFDEFLAANELELALHVACDFLLDSKLRLVDSSIVSRIEAAHAAMNLNDECVERLRMKCFA
jgi:hypothetical protein